MASTGDIRHLLLFVMLLCAPSCALSRDNAWDPARCGAACPSGQVCFEGRCEPRAADAQTADGAPHDAGEADLLRPDGVEPDRAAPDGDGPPADVLSPDGPPADGLSPDSAPADALSPDTTPTICGNDTIEGNEECDGVAFRPGKSQCSDFNRNGGNLQCKSCKVDLSLCCLAPIPPAGSTTWNAIVSSAVGDDGTVAPLCKPYKTITAALNAAPAFPVGAAIWVASGTYSAGETFPITLDGAPYVLLAADESPAASPTIIEGVGTSTLDGGPAVIQASAANCLQGFQIKGAGSGVRGVVYSGGETSGAAVWRNEFFTDVGIEISSSTTCPVILQDNTFHTATLGARLQCQGATSIERNTFTGGTGLRLPDAAADVVVQDNTFTGGAVAIALEGGAPQILGNDFSGAQTGGAIACASGASPKLRSNTFSVGVAPAQAIVILDTASPDVGTAGDLGKNTFLGAALAHAGSAAIQAVGNDWPGTPACGTSIVVSGTGHVVWGASGEQCP